MQTNQSLKAWLNAREASDEPVVFFGTALATVFLLGWRDRFRCVCLDFLTHRKVQIFAEQV